MCHLHLRVSTLDELILSDASPPSHNQGCYMFRWHLLLLTVTGRGGGYPNLYYTTLNPTVDIYISRKKSANQTAKDHDDPDSTPKHQPAMNCWWRGATWICKQQQQQQQQLYATTITATARATTGTIYTTRTTTRTARTVVATISNMMTNQTPMGKRAQVNIWQPVIPKMQRHGHKTWTAETSNTNLDSKSRG